MKNFKFIVLLVLLISCKSNKVAQVNFDCQDEDACFEYEKKLKLIHDYNFLLKKINHDELIKVGSFLKELL